MPDLPQLDDRLALALRGYADSALRPYDALAITRSARDLATTRRPVWRPGRTVALAIGLGLLVALVIATFAFVGQRPSAKDAFPLGSIAYTRDGGLFVAASDGSDVVRVADIPFCCEVGDFRFAPDGRHLAYLDLQDEVGSAARLVMLDASGRAVGSHATSGGTQFAWSPDGARLAVVSNTPGAVAADLTYIDIEGRPTGSIALPTGFGLTSYFGQTAISWSPDGHWLAIPGCNTPCDSKSKSRFLLVAANGKGSHWLPVGGALDLALAWAPDSSRIALVAGPSLDLLAADGTLEREIAMPQITDPELVRVAWAPDGTRLVVLGDTSHPDRLDIVGTDGTTSSLSTAGVGGITSARWSADGQRILFVGSRQSDANSPGLWSIAVDGSDLRSLITSVDWKVIDLAGQP